MAPASVITLITRYIDWLEFISTGLAMPSGRLEKPALQNADREWNAENISWSSSDMSSTSRMDHHMNTAPAASIAMVNRNMYSRVGMSALIDFVYIMSLTTSWLYTELLPL